MEIRIKINKKNNMVFIRDRFYFLSKNETTLLELLYNNPDVVFSVRELSDKCWPGKVVSYNSVPVAIKHIRDIFKINSGCADIIQTRKGEGYQFCGNDLVINFEDNDESAINQEERGGGRALLFLVVCPICILPVIFIAVCSIFR
ncbi:winged helix-turn-helix transcriptional regulator [Salmonella enterica]|nr:winged helix-turn-helix transcriptional regulator [Salmonella enterica]EIP6687080.1 winged helix-turn-helix transcriptional regulator [Salmonella enterica subsp. enterica serovar Javiana]EIP6742426.1 winged helix-turn-helix transcriptional regulator [Salmonella enterica subsp. enterica serovar Javiana]EIQ4670386.1 winged helix-turn-helix transcriptional regulator [Salmonella enterica subsp. enterica serovar Javiana]EIR2402425.1 winged helix-turn-helix transcriptional regulator [Salmonella en